MFSGFFLYVIVRRQTGNTGQERVYDMQHRSGHKVSFGRNVVKMCSGTVKAGLTGCYSAHWLFHTMVDWSLCSIEFGKL